MQYPLPFTTKLQETHAWQRKMGYPNYRSTFMSFLVKFTGIILLFLLITVVQAAPPALLFVMPAHNGYIVKPLVAQGFTVDTCKPAELPARLATGKYNVAIIDTLPDTERAAVDAFLAKGGGVFVCFPAGSFHAAENWTKTNAWLATRWGARPRWELLRDSDEKNIVQDIMNCRLSWSSQISAPVNDGVPGVLTLMWNSTGGCEPPMSYDLSPEWTPVVRGAATMTEAQEKRNDIPIQPWQPTSGFRAAPPLLALRNAGTGRLAVIGICAEWLITPPDWCPTTEVMLTKGAGGKSSNWLRVMANTFRWLAEPSLAAGLGGATTPEQVLNPPVEIWPILPQKTWEPSPALPGDHVQYPGLIGARTALSTGTGTVADYVKAAKAAKLSFIVFLEDALRMDAAKWDQLVADCKANSDAAFAAMPGITYEDAQGNHLYAFAAGVQFPKPGMLLPDRRIATNQSYRTRAYFDYVNELMIQKSINGFWNHKANYIPPADYKLYNSFPIFSAENGKPIDDNFADYQYLQSVGGCQSVLAFEMMTSPSQVAQRARDGWRVMSYRTPEFLRTEWQNAAMTFSGTEYGQYITQGPTIPVWEAPNRMAETHGEWWRPDLEEYRLRFRAASERGLKTVTLYDGLQVYRRWLPRGVKTFAKELVLPQAQQHAFYLVVEDRDGKRAISMSFWTRNLMQAGYLLTDRCNFMGDARLRTKDGMQWWVPVGFRNHAGIPPNKGLIEQEIEPAIWLTAPSPTLPIDGAPGGFPTQRLTFYPNIPDELRYIFSSPSFYLVGREIAIGHCDYRLGYDPAEIGAKATPLGHPYEQPQQGTGNAWSSWHHLIPTRKVDGYVRTYACNFRPPDAFRIGWHETNLTVKEPFTLEKDGMQVMYVTGKNWSIYRDGKPIATPDMDNVTGAFTRGTVAVLPDSGGAIVAMPMDGPLRFRYYRSGFFSLFYAPDGVTTLKTGDPLRYTVAFAGGSGRKTLAEMLAFADQFGVTKPGTVAYAPTVAAGKTLDNFLVWSLASDGTKVMAKLPKAPLTAFLPARVQGVHDDWSVYLQDRARKGVNFRALPVRDGIAYAQLDTTEADADLFIGHPVTCDQPAVTLHLAWQEPGLWFLEAHNSTTKPITTTLKSTPGWTRFSINTTVSLQPGESKIWRVME
jgi:hypothetical protein